MSPKGILFKIREKELKPRIKSFKSAKCWAEAIKNERK